MPKPIPPNFPRSMTGVAIIDWICQGEKFGLFYPDDYKVNGLPATDILDLAKVYELIYTVTVPTKGYIHQNVTGDLVEAVELTPEVQARLSKGGAISAQQISDTVAGWNDQTPAQKKELDIKKLFENGGVDY